ncbi:MAG: hypothetical protein WD795_18140 [Woeseia sp.]
MQQLIPLTRPDKLQAAGLPFETTDSARWAFRKAADNGTAAAFVRCGRRVYVDPDKFHELVRSRQAA